MKDIDFDELDRAVNSLMGSVSKTDPVKSDDVKTLNLSSASTSGAAPIPSPSQPSASVPAADVGQPAVRDDANSTQEAASLASRRGGRFMDVVHPSSDMTKPTPSQGVSRQGLTIEPRSGMPQPPQATDTTLVQSEESVVPEPEAPVPSVSDTPKEQQDSGSAEWPDPLEVSSSQSEIDVAPESPVPTASAAPDESASAAATDEQFTPLTSPFLADAKVEKRPLGGGLAGTQPDKAEEPSHSPVLGVLNQETPTNDDVDNQLPPDPTDVGVPLPEELSGDLMAIESDTRPVSRDAEPAPAVVETAAEPTNVREAATAVRPQAPTGPSSITQQYKEEPSTGDQTSGAIFDTSAYHQPLAHPAKKSSSWLWIIGVIGLLLLGAAGGAALYFLGIV